MSGRKIKAMTQLTMTGDTLVAQRGARTIAIQRVTVKARTA